MALIEAYRWAAQLPDLVRTVEEAIDVGKAMRDPEAVARAAMATSFGALWRSGPPGSVNEKVVDALRGSLDRLPPEDSDLRCRSMLALANELSDTVTMLERQALVDEGMAMARRLGDPALLMDACQLAFVSLWVAETAPERHRPGQRGPRPRPHPRRRAQLRGVRDACGPRCSASWVGPPR